MENKHENIFPKGLVKMKDIALGVGMLAMDFLAKHITSDGLSDHFRLDKPIPRPTIDDPQEIIIGQQELPFYRTGENRWDSEGTYLDRE